MTARGSVLVVDDQESHRYVIGSWLRRAGYTVTEAATGAEALVRVNAGLDVVVLDVNLPDMSGMEVCAAIKGDPAISLVPVMHISATATDASSRAAGLDAGADAYLIEPLDEDVFLATIRALARTRADQRSADHAMDRLTRVAAATVPVNAADTVVRLLEAAAIGAADIFGAAAIAVGALDTGRTARVVCPSPEAGVVVEPNREPLDWSLWGPDAVFIPAEGAPPQWTAILDRAGLPPQQWVVVPIEDADGTVSGGLAVSVAAATATFDDSGLTLLRQLAAGVSVALKNLRAFAEEHRIALTLQRALLPESLPVVAGLQFAARYLASNEQVSVGGDFYDVFELSSGEVAMVIGDVQGHSLRAATVMAELRFSLRAYLSELHRPAAAVSLLNDLVQRSQPEETATMVLLVFDPTLSYVDVVNAGHLPPVFLTPGEAVLIEEHGALLGIPARTTTPVRLQLPADSVFVLTTDGLIERRGHSLDTDLEELRSTVRSVGSLDPDEIADHLLMHFAADNAADDVAVLVVRRN